MVLHKNHAYASLVSENLVHKEASEYIRTLALALVYWCPWMDNLAACAFVEESCEALLSRMSHRCEVHRQLVGLESTIDLYLTIPETSTELKTSRGAVRKGLVLLFTERLRRVLYSDGSMPFVEAPKGKSMHTQFIGVFAEEVQPFGVKSYTTLLPKNVFFTLF